jgi:ATP-dependent exoDNAse (exonuclease V) alpha subunit
VVIIDETSMVDTLIMFHLLKAISMNSVLILVGDVFQLPAVGPGNVLALGGRGKLQEPLDQGLVAHKMSAVFLTPMHKGVIGTGNLNQTLQRVLNAESAVSGKGGGGFRLGDKVMHLKNNYQTEVFNGDIGTINSIEASKRCLSVDYYGRIVKYEFTEIEELSLEDAITVQKSQGS